jgi:hypothetical protein
MNSIINVIAGSEPLGYVLVFLSMTAGAVCLEILFQRFGLTQVKRKRPYLRSLILWATLYIAFAAIYAIVLSLPEMLYTKPQGAEYYKHGSGIRLGSMLLAGMGFSGLIAGITVFASILENSMSRAAIALLGFWPIWALWTAWNHIAGFYAAPLAKTSDQVIEKANLDYAQAIELPLLPVIVWALIAGAVLMATLKPQSEDSFTN